MIKKISIILLTLILCITGISAGTITYDNIDININSLANNTIYGIKDALFTVNVTANDSSDDGSIIQIFQDSINITERNGTIMNNGVSIGGDYSDIWLDFNGIDSYATIPSDSTLDIGLDDYTVLVKFKTTDTVGRLFTKYNSTVNWQLGINNGKINLYVYNGTWLINNQETDTLVNDGEWHTVIWSLDRDSNSIIYIDGFSDYGTGESVSSFENTSISTSGDVYIGKRGDSVAFYNGSIDYVKVWNKKLTANQIVWVGNEQNDYVTWLGYHQVGDDAGINDCDPSLSRFNIQMQGFYDLGYETITPENYYQWTLGNYVLPEKPLIITFDDGLKSVYTNAFPIMETYGFIGTTYVISSRVGTNYSYDYLTCAETVMDWDEIQELSDAGWEIGSHTYNHTSLGDISSNETELIHQLNDSKTQIEANLLGVNVNNFAYPRASRDNITDEVVSRFYHTSPANSNWGINPETVPNYFNLGRRFCGNNAFSICFDSTLYGVNMTDLKINDTNISLNLNENSGTIIYDSSINKNNGTTINTLWMHNNIPTSSYLYFNGVNGSINLDNDSRYKPNQLSLVVWFKGEDSYSSAFPHLFKAASGTHYGYSLYSNGGSLTFGLSNGTATTNIGIAPTNTSYPRMLVGTYDGITGKIYLDSIFKTQLASDLVYDSGDVIIGNRGIDDRYWNGSIYKVFLFNRTLSQTEITELYSSGKDELSPIRNGIVGEWSTVYIHQGTDNFDAIYDTSEYLIYQKYNFNSIFDYYSLASKTYYTFFNSFNNELNLKSTLYTFIINKTNTLFNGITIITNDSNTSVVFNDPIVTNNLTVTNDSILIYNFIVDGCINVEPFYQFSGNNAIFYTSTLTTSLGCVLQQDYKLLDDILFLAISLSIIILFLGIGGTQEYIIYVFYIFIAAIIVLISNFLINLL